MVKEGPITCLGGLRLQLFPHWGYKSFLIGLEATPTQHLKVFASLKSKGCNCVCRYGCFLCHLMLLGDYCCNLLPFRCGECVRPLSTNGIYRRGIVDTWYQKFQFSSCPFNPVLCKQYGHKFDCCYCMFLCPDHLDCPSPQTRRHRQ